MSSAAAGSLRRYLLVRVLLVIPNVFVLLTIVFLLLRVAPGDPVTAAVGGQLSPDKLAERRAAAGLDRPILAQYWDYVSHAVVGDFGTTLTDRRSIGDIVAVNGMATVSLTISAVLVAIVLGVPLGLLAARYRNTWLDVFIRLFGVLTYAAPVFFVGVVAIVLFTNVWPILPSSGQASPIAAASVEPHTNLFVVDALIDGQPQYALDGLQHLVLPGITLGFLVTGVLIRLIRVNVAQTLRDDYVEAARARGVSSWRVTIHHAFRNAMVPFVTVLGLQIALLLGGAILTEATFSWPGIGGELVRYINARDYIAVQGILTVFALVVVVISLLIDLVNAMIDPRVRY